MTVINVRQVLEQGIVEALDECVPDDIQVAWYFGDQTVEGECEEHGCATVEHVWHLNLHLIHDTPSPTGETVVRRATSMTGAIPFLACNDGDARPVRELAVKMVECFQFDQIMAGDGLDVTLAQIAEDDTPEG